jgi:hypothetical protein
MRKISLQLSLSSTSITKRQITMWAQSTNRLRVHQVRGEILVSENLFKLPIIFLVTRINIFETIVKPMIAYKHYDDALSLRAVDLRFPIKNDRLNCVCAQVWQTKVARRLPNNMKDSTASE